MADNDNEKPSDEAGRDPRLLYADEEQESGIFRWMSALVVLLAIAGFFGLAWYAYKSGGEAVDEKDVELVKADKTPVKETPANPGGMQIPNQDKTVYGLIGGNKSDKAVVERVLPAPEEPVARTGGETETWMSDKAKNKIDTTSGSEKPSDITVTPNASPAAPPVDDAKKTEQFNPVQAQLAQNDQKNDIQETKQETVTPAAPVAVPAETSVAGGKPAEAHPNASPVPSAPVIVKEVTPKKEQIQPVASTEADDEDDAQKETTPSKPKAEAAAVPPKGVRAQLGAYKSEEEAKSNWNKISKKFSSEMGSKQHYIVRADLGDKGVFYRLQIAPFASSKEAEEFCLTLVSADQNCFLAKAK